VYCRKHAVVKEYMEIVESNPRSWNQKRTSNFGLDIRGTTPTTVLHLVRPSISFVYYFVQDYFLSSLVRVIIREIIIFSQVFVLPRYTMKILRLARGNNNAASLLAGYRGHGFVFDCYGASMIAAPSC